MVFIKKYRCNVEGCDAFFYKYRRCAVHYFNLCRFRKLKGDCECTENVGNRRTCVAHRFQFVRNQFFVTRNGFPLYLPKRRCIHTNCIYETYRGNPFCTIHDAMYCKFYDTKDPNSRCLQQVSRDGPPMCAYHLHYNENARSPRSPSS